MQRLRAKKAFIIDMDGVVYHGDRRLPGVVEFMAWLAAEGKQRLFLTNASNRSPHGLQAKMRRMGITARAAEFYTSAQAAAAFVAAQHPGGRAYVIGERCLKKALTAAGIAPDDTHPDVVVVGETPHWSFNRVKHAVNLVCGGAALIGTNPDAVDPGDNEWIPSTGAMIASIEKAAGVRAFFVGKPNPMMIYQGLAMLGAAPRDAVIIGDRLDTDILAGLQAGIDTVLVLSGITASADLARSAFQPAYVLDGVGEIPG